MEVRGQEPLKNTRTHIRPFGPTDRSPIGISIPDPFLFAPRVNPGMAYRQTPGKHGATMMDGPLPPSRVRSRRMTSRPFRLSRLSRLVITARLSATSSNSGRAFINPLGIRDALEEGEPQTTISRADSLTPARPTGPHADSSPLIFRKAT